MHNPRLMKYLRSEICYPQLGIIYPNYNVYFYLSISTGPNIIKILQSHCAAFLGQSIVLRTRQGSPVNRRPSTAEAPPIGKIRPFSELAVTFEPLMEF